MTRKTVSFDVNPLFSGPTLEERTRSGSPFRFLPLSDIDVDPDQPRRVFESEGLAELAASIKEYGVLSPVLVRVTAGGTYRLVSGERRYRACKLIGLQTIPAMIDPAEGEQVDALCKQLVENLQREDLTPMERALAVGQLRDKFSLSVRDIARALSVSKSMVQRSLEILALPDDLQAALIEGAPESKILLLGQVNEPSTRKKLLKQLDLLTRTELKEEIDRIFAEKDDAEKVSHGGTGERGGKRGKSLSVEDKRVVDQLQHSLGTKVQLLRGKRKPKQGKIVIEFYSDEDLDGIYQRLTD